MRANFCHRFLACNLKILNFFQFFIGIATLIFSGFLLDRWQNRASWVPSPPPRTPVPPLGPKFIPSLNSDVGSLEVFNQFDAFNLARELFSGSKLNFGAGLHSVQLPAPWFIYFLMAAGGMLVGTSCIGHIAAEAMSGCCLCFYLLLSFVLLLLEAALVPFFAINHEWEKDLPYDPTGELERFRYFVQENADICKWVGVTLVTVQALSLLLSLVLRALISTRGKEPNIENGYAASGQPLLNSQQNQSPGTAKCESKRALFGMWMNQLRQKYGLNKESSKGHTLNVNESPAVKS